MPRKRTDTEVARHRERAAELTLVGWKQADIAAELGTSQPTIARDLEAVKAGWRRQMLDDWATHKARELAALDEMERQAWAAWESSKRGTTRHQKWLKNEELSLGEAASKPVPVRATTITRNQHGKPACMKQLLRISDRRVKLLGLDKPVPCEAISDAVDPTQMTLEERARRALEMLRSVQ